MGSLSGQQAPHKSPGPRKPCPRTVPKHSGVQGQSPGKRVARQTKNKAQQLELLSLKTAKNLPREGQNLAFLL